MYKFLLGALLLCTSPLLAQQPILSPQNERNRAELDARTRKVTDETFLYLSTFNLPTSHTLLDGEILTPRKSAELALPFVLNTLANFRASSLVVRPKLVKDGGEPTLWVVDIADFGWSRQDIAQVFRLQPYFLSPVVEGKSQHFFFRADWFMVHSLETVRQEDRGFKNNDIIYKTLLYGLDNHPKDKADFRKRWGSVATNASSATIVDAGDSGVSRRSRKLLRIGTENNYGYETQDNRTNNLEQTTVKRRDFIEDIGSNKTHADASESIYATPRGFHAFDLTAGVLEKFKPVNQADPGIVFNKTGGDDIRVSLALTCLHCHAGGLIPYTNTFADFFRSNGKILSNDKEFIRGLQGVYTKYRGEEIENDNRFYAAAVKKANGLTPFETQKHLDDLVKFYDLKVTPGQAAIELGITPTQLKALIKIATTNLVGRSENQSYARVSMLGLGTPIPREVFDSIFDGVYVQLGLELVGEEAFRSNLYYNYEDGVKVARQNGVQYVISRGVSSSFAERCEADCRKKGFVYCVVAPSDNRFSVGTNIFEVPR